MPGDLPGVLEEQGASAVAPVGCAVSCDVGGDVDVVHARGAVDDGIEVAEHEPAVGAGHEQVEQVKGLVRGAEAQDMVAGEVIECAVELQPRVFVGVGVAEAVAAGDEVDAAGQEARERRFGNAVGVKVELQRAHAGRPAVLPAIERLAVDAHRRRQPVAPVGEELNRDGGEFDRYIDPGRLEPVGSGRRLALPAALVRERRPVRLVRVPVQLDQRALRRRRGGRRRRAAAGIVAVGIADHLAQALEEPRLDAVGGIEGAEVHWLDGLELVVGKEHEETVAEQRTADGGAVFFFLETCGREGAVAVVGAADEAAALTMVERRAVPLVRP